MHYFQTSSVLCFRQKLTKQTQMVRRNIEAFEYVFINLQQVYWMH